MIVQTAPKGAPRFVMRMTQHTAFAGGLARAFGNARFEPVSPREEMLFVIDHHDEGWVAFDAEPRLDPETELPYHLVNTPRDIAIQTGVRSADFNEAHHPYSGLLSSMHIWGLYNGRYGFSDQVLIGDLPEEWRPRFEEMLAGQMERQEDLKRKLSNDPATADWIEQDRLFQNYKQLQFFDTLALYFHCTHDAARGETTFKHVPESRRSDTSITVRRITAGVYCFDPYPWNADGLTLTFDGRLMTPHDKGRSMDDIPVSSQTVKFVRKSND